MAASSESRRLLNDSDDFESTPLAESKSDAFTFLSDVLAQPFKIHGLKLTRNYSAEEIAQWTQQFNPTVEQWKASQNLEGYLNHLKASNEIQFDEKGYFRRDEDGDKEYVSTSQVELAFAEVVKERKQNKMHFYVEIHHDPDEENQRWIGNLLKSDHMHCITIKIALPPATLDNLISKFRPSLNVIIADECAFTDAQARTILDLWKTIPESDERRFNLNFSGENISSETAVEFAQLKRKQFFIRIENCEVFTRATLKNYELSQIKHTDSLLLTEHEQYDETDLKILTSNLAKREERLAEYTFKLTITSGNYTAAGWGEFFQALASTPTVRLTTVEVSGGRFSDEVAIAFVTSLSTCQTLQRLALSSELRAAWDLLPNVAGNTSLTSLSLRHCAPLLDIQLRGVFRALSEEKSPALRELDISHSYCGDELKGHIAHFLREKPTLRVLRLGACNLHDEAIMTLSNFLRSPSCSLTDLSLYENDFSNAGLDYLGRALRINRTLTKLSVNHNQVFAHSRRPPYTNSGLVTFNRHLDCNSSIVDITTTNLVESDIRTPSADDILNQQIAICERNKAIARARENQARTVVEQNFVETAILIFQALRTKNRVFCVEGGKIAPEVVAYNLLHFLAPNWVKPEWTQQCINLIRDNMKHKQWRSTVKKEEAYGYMPGSWTRTLTIFKPSPSIAQRTKARENYVWQAILLMQWLRVYMTQHPEEETGLEPRGWLSVEHGFNTGTIQHILSFLAPSYIPEEEVKHCNILVEHNMGHRRWDTTLVKKEFGTQTSIIVFTRHRKTTPAPLGVEEYDPDYFAYPLRSSSTLFSHSSHACSSTTATSSASASASASSSALCMSYHSVSEP